MSVVAHMILCVRRWAPLEGVWSDVVAKYSVFVARHPWPFIIVPLVLSAFLSTGLLKDFQILRGVKYLYAPLNAEWKTEEAVLGETWANDDKHFYPGKDVMRRRGVYLIAEAKDSGNVLRKEYADEFLRIIDWITTENFTTPRGRAFTYSDVCLRFRNECFSNSQAKLVADIFTQGHENDLNVTYPLYRTRFSTEPVDLMNTLGNTTVDEYGRLTSAKAWLLLFQLKNHENGTNQLSGFTVTFSILITFSIICTFTFHWVQLPGTQTNTVPVIDWVVSKPIMGIVGVVAAVLAISSSMGLMLWMQVPFVDMCTVMPFLSLTIGIDDTFLMLAAWHETNRCDPVNTRIERAMRHAAVSISITSLTDALAFLIGAIAPLPAVMYFCYYASVAIIFIFFHCMTIFIAALSLQGHWEAKRLHCVTGAKTRKLGVIEKATTTELFFYMGSETFDEETNNNTHEGKSGNNSMWYERFFTEKFGPMIVSKYTRPVAFLLFVAYIAVAAVGLQNLVVGFDIANIVQKDSLSRLFLEERQEMFPEDLSMLDVAVMKPPHMGNHEDREAFYAVLNEIETTHCSEGRNTTTFWYFAYKEYMDQLGFPMDWDTAESTVEDFTEELRPFLMTNDRFAYDVKMFNGSIEHFRFSTRLRNVTDDAHMYQCALTMRSICARHAEYNISTYTPLWNLADQFQIMWPQTLQDIYISILVMIPVSLLFIPQPLCSLAIGINIASIALGVMGFMSWWGVNLDCTSMITIAMSVGFSVDFAAHVSYAYMTEPEVPVLNLGIAESRLCRTLGTVGWPITQASFSVLLGVSTLGLVDSYVVSTIFRTIVLVILFGTLHALVFLPLVLMQTHNIYLTFKSSTKNISTEDAASTSNTSTTDTSDTVQTTDSVSIEVPKDSH